MGIGATLLGFANLDHDSFPSFFITVSINFEAALWVEKNSTTASIDVIPAARLFD
jgi:hypothetical protein